MVASHLAPIVHALYLSVSHVEMMCVMCVVVLCLWLEPWFAFLLIARGHFAHRPRRCRIKLCRAAERNEKTPFVMTPFPWIALKIHSERSSGELAKLPGKWGGEFWEVQGLPEARGSLTPSQCHAEIVSRKSRVPQTNM